MKIESNLLAFDCSNTNIRTILGHFDGEKITEKIVWQQPNEAIRINGIEYWDILGIFKGMLKGLSMAVKEVNRVDSIGICTWGVDFSLVTKEGFILGNPVAYRNSFGEEALQMFSLEKRSELYKNTGILSDKINSLYMLKGLERSFPTLIESAEHLLMIPDILNYMFTGIMQNEPSELSTSQLFDVSNMRVSQAVCEIAGVKNTLIGEIGVHGELIGNLSEDIKNQIGIQYDIPVLCVPSHDTASAIFAIPAKEKEFAYISSGTWALIGTELNKPIINQLAEEFGFTNELGAFGSITFLKNHAGMFIVQRLKEEYDPEMGWDEFYELSDAVGNDVPIFDVNDSAFFNPKSMTQAIRSSYQKSGQKIENPDIAVLIKSFMISMALSYKKTIEQLEKLSGKSFPVIYIVGGGVKNKRLCQLTADITGKRVITGCSESTSLGNIVAQIAGLHKEVRSAECREIIRKSIQCTEYIGRDNQK